MCISTETIIKRLRQTMEIARKENNYCNGYDKYKEGVADLISLIEEEGVRVSPQHEPCYD